MKFCEYCREGDVKAAGVEWGIAKIVVLSVEVRWLCEVLQGGGGGGQFMPQFSPPPLSTLSVPPTLIHLSLTTVHEPSLLNPSTAVYPSFYTAI